MTLFTPYTQHSGIIMVYKYKKSHLFEPILIISFRHFPQRCEIIVLNLPPTAADNKTPNELSPDGFKFYEEKNLNTLNTIYIHPQKCFCIQILVTVFLMYLDTVIRYLEYRHKFMRYCMVNTYQIIYICVYIPPHHYIYIYI